MITNDSDAEKSADATPNQDARTAHTCVECGKTDTQVTTMGLLGESSGSVAVHDKCAPPMPELNDWLRRRLDE